MFRPFAWLCLTALAAASPAQAQTLSLAQAQQLAAGRSRELAAQDLAASAARQMAVAAGQLPDPVLKLGIDNLPVTGPDQFSATRDFMTMRRIGIMQELTRGAKRELRARRYESEAEKSKAEKAAALAGIQRDTALAWLDRYYAEAMAGVLREEIAQAGLEVQAAEAAYRGARASQADVFAAHGAVAELEDRAAGLASRVRVAKANLARWIGSDADEPLADPPGMESVPLDAASLEAHLAAHPEMVVLAKQEEIAETEARLAEAMAGVLREQIGQAGLEVQAAEAAYRGARASQADVFAAHGAVAALQDRAAELASRVRVAKANLARWIGQGADQPLADAPAMDEVPLDMAMLETHLASHPEMVVLAKQEEIAETEARLAEESRTPDWTVEIADQQRGPEFSNMLSFGVSLPLPWDRGNRQDREAAAKLAQAEQARAQREEALRAHAGEVRAMLAEWQSGRERLSRYRGELVPLARERARASLAAYEGGRTSITELLAARRNESEVRLQAVQLESETARLWAKLTYLVPHTEQGR